MLYLDVVHTSDLESILCVKISILITKKFYSTTLMLNKIDNSPLTKEPVVGFRATGTIDRAAYGMTAYASGITTNVPIQIDGELVEKK